MAKKDAAATEANPFDNLGADGTVHGGKVAALAQAIRDHADGKFDPALLRTQVTRMVMHGMATSAAQGDADFLDWTKLLASVAGLTKAVDQSSNDPRELDKRIELERLAEEQNAAKRPA